MSSQYRFRKYSSDCAFDNHFGTDEEFKSVLHRVDLTGDSIPLNHGGAAFYSDTKEAYVDDGDYHTLILGSTGSMKTRLFIFPTVFTLGLAGENMVITDPKGEIFERTSGYLKAKGYDIKVLNLRDMKHSDTWNPLSEAAYLFSKGQKEKAMEVASNFITALVDPLTDKSTDAYWPNAAKDFLYGAAETLIRGATCKEEVNISSLMTFTTFCHSSSKSEDGQILKEFAERLPMHNSIREHLDATVNNAPITMDCIMSFVTNAISPLSTSKALQYLASGCSIDVHAFKDPDKKTAIFVIVPDDSTTFHFFVASFIKQVYSAAINDAFESPGGSLPRRVNFLLDEFANIPRIPDMATMITAARSRNIRFYLVIQSDSQLKANYKKSAETIKTNCLNWVFLASKESQLIDQIQMMIGTRDRSVDSDPLISYFELTNLRKVFDSEYGGAEAIILVSRSKPFKTFLPDISRYKQFEGYGCAPLPDTTSNIVYFDVRARCANISDEDLMRLYHDEEVKVDPHAEDRVVPPEED